MRLQQNLALREAEAGDRVGCGGSLVGDNFLAEGLPHQQRYGAGLPLSVFVVDEIGLEFVFYFGVVVG